MSKILITLLCALLSTVSVRSEDAWKEYANGRFGFLLRYPGTLLASREPDNGGGREFHTPDKEFSVVAVGHFLISDIGDSLEKRWQDDLKSLGETITYKKKTATWYVVSGVTKEGTEYYHKFHAKESNWSGFRITYPRTKNKKYDPWVTRIEKSFVPFLEGDYDRIQK